MMNMLNLTLKTNYNKTKVGKTKQTKINRYQKKRENNYKD